MIDDEVTAKAEKIGWWIGVVLGLALWALVFWGVYRVGKAAGRAKL